MNTYFKKIKGKLLIAFVCAFFITFAEARSLGEQPGGDSGTGGEGDSGGNSVGVSDGGRGSGKGGSGDGPHRSGNGGDGTNAAKVEQRPEPEILRVIGEHVTNPNLNQPLEGVVSTERMQNGNVVEHADIKTADKLEEALSIEQSGHISEGMAREREDDEQSDTSDNLGPDRPNTGHADGLQAETEGLRNLALNAKNQAKSNESKSRLDRLLNFVEKYNEYQKNYNKKIEAKASGITQEETSQLSGMVKHSNQNQTLPTLKEVFESMNVDSASLQLTNISKTIAGLMSGTVGSVANSFMDFIKGMLDKRSMNGAPYVKEALRNSLTGGASRVLNPIEPVREKLMEKVRSYLAIDVKIRYSQKERTKPNTFDCSSFVVAVYNNFELGLSKTNGGVPNVVGIIKSGLFHEIDMSEAKQGDLIVHFAEENDNEDNHIGFFDSQNEQGNIFEISATTANGRATLDPVKYKNEFKSSIAKNKAKVFGEFWHYYKWNK